VFAEVAINSGGANGLLFGNPHQLLVQVIAVCASGIYSFVATWIILKVLAVFKFPMRVSSQVEAEGLDIAVHGERAYGAH
jgi:Amt family ammonium transporter